MTTLAACKIRPGPVEPTSAYNISTSTPTHVQLNNVTEQSPPTNDTLSLDWMSIMILIICTLGIIGNILNLIVLTRRRLMMSMDRLEKSANYGLIALAISDMGFCSAALPFVFRSDNPHDVFTLYYRVYGVGLINLFLMSSTWLIVSMAISRYIVVVYPIHARFTLAAVKTIVIIILVYVVSSIITIPYFIRISVEPCLSESNEVHHQYKRNFDKKTSDNLKFYTVWIWPVISTFLPLIILFFCNARLIQELRNASRSRRISARGQRVRDPSQKVTLTLVIIVLMLFVFVMPAEVLKYYNPYKWGYVGEVMAMAANVMQNINFAFNFVLYCVLSPSFRQTIKSLMPECYQELGDKMEMQTMLTTTVAEKIPAATVPQDV